MAVSAEAQPTPTVAPQRSLPFVDITTGILTDAGHQVLQQLQEFTRCTSRMIPCDVATADQRLYTLTLLSAQPVVIKYLDYEVFAFVSPALSIGDVTAEIVTTSGSLGVRKVYKDSTTQATGGDISSGGLHWLVYADSLDSGNGGFFLK